ncbi:MAG: energy-coupling factor transporter ATPase [Lachnospiraceae bacterium]|nr:energy-coupling factor transporter ATPase [Lachnospiraceae bacterium]
MVLELRNVSYIYSEGMAFEVKALNNINLGIEKGQFIGVIGHTGSGKSTLIQHMNGLMKPTEGQVLYDGQDIWGGSGQDGSKGRKSGRKDKYDLRRLRTRVGLVFQYPENQLFETDVITDVSFGPKNQGLAEDEILVRAKEALSQTGVAEKYWKVSPFELSGGQKRRVAIAGVLAMNPEVLILDEPTAGLDPKGRDDILDQIKKLHDERGITILLVSHSMEDVANYADRIIVMNNGEIAYDGTPKEVFAHYRELEQMGLAAPQTTYVMNELAERGLDVDTEATTIREAKESISRALGLK